MSNTEKLMVSQIEYEVIRNNLCIFHAEIIAPFGT